MGRLLCASSLKTSRVGHPTRVGFALARANSSSISSSGVNSGDLPAWRSSAIGFVCRFIIRAKSCLQHWTFLRPSLCRPLNLLLHAMKQNIDSSDGAAKTLRNLLTGEPSLLPDAHHTLIWRQPRKNFFKEDRALYSLSASKVRRHAREKRMAFIRANRRPVDSQRASAHLRHCYATHRHPGISVELLDWPRLSFVIGDLAAGFLQNFRNNGCVFQRGKASLNFRHEITQ